MDVRVLGFVIANQPVDDRAGLLRGGGVVEIHQRLAVGLRVKNWEIGANFSHVEGGMAVGGWRFGNDHIWCIVGRAVESNRIALTSPATGAPPEPNRRCAPGGTLTPQAHWRHKATRTSLLRIARMALASGDAAPGAP